MLNSEEAESIEADPVENQNRLSSDERDSVSSSPLPSPPSCVPRSPQSSRPPEKPPPQPAPRRSTRQVKKPAWMDSMYLKLIDDVTDVPTEYSFKESVCSTELDGYPDIDLDQLVRQAKNVLHKYTTDKTEAGPSVTNNKEKPDSRTVYKESNQVKHKYKDDIKTSGADLALSGNDIASAKTPMEVDVNKRTIDVKHVIADAVKMSVVDKTSTEVKNSKTVSKEVVINKNNTSNEACTMNDAVSRKDTKELCGELTKDKLTQPSNIPQTHLKGFEPRTLSLSVQALYQLS